MRRIKPWNLRRRLSYANVMATVALFFALTGASMAGVKYMTNGDPAGGDLTGTYPNPTIKPSRLMSANVRRDGSLAYASTPGLTSELSSTGFYRITVPAGTPQDCAAVASPMAFVVAGVTLSVLRLIAPDGFLVAIINRTDGSSSNSPFSIIITC